MTSFFYKHCNLYLLVPQKTDGEYRQKKEKKLQIELPLNSKKKKKRSDISSHKSRSYGCTTSKNRLGRS